MLLSTGVRGFEPLSDSEQSDYWCTLLDAIGTPIPHADVEIFHKEADGTKTFIKKAKLDELGRLQVPKPGRKDVGDYFLVITHDDYGTAVVDMAFYRMAHTIELAIVKAATKADVRGIQGVVLDDANNPVNNAVVICHGIRLPGGEAVGTKMCGVLTNDQGRFWIYPPLLKSGDLMGTLIPPGSKFSIKVKAKAEDGLLEFRTRVTTGEKIRIKLERGSHFRTFVFNDESGRITDPDRLKRIHMYVRRKGIREIHFTYDQIKDGGMFPLGTYRTSMWGGADEWSKYFVDVEITEDSPSEIVFKIRPAYVYCGKVVHGLTGAPMEGVFVAAAHGDRNLAMIKADQWKRLHGLPQNPSISNTSLKKIVTDIFMIRAITRTDDHGRFELALIPGEGRYPIVAFEENFMVSVRKYFPDPNGDHCTQLPPMRLYPAAKVLVGCYTEGAKAHYDPIFHVEQQDNPLWAKSFLDDYPMRRVIKGSAKTNRENEFYFPANLNLRIELQTGSLSKWCSLILDEEFHFEQGKLYNLGRINLEHKIKVYLKVVDDSGKALEGICVSLNSRGFRKNTDEMGYVVFDVPPNSKGNFIVEYLPEQDQHLNEPVPYEVRGIEDSNCIYEFRVTDKRTRRILNQ
jgi:hypothetical protein